MARKPRMFLPGVPAHIVERGHYRSPTFSCRKMVPQRSRMGWRVYNSLYYTHSEASMRTNIVIDDKLMSKVLKLTPYKTKREAVEAGRELLVKMARQQRIHTVRGKLRWEGDLDAMRRDA